MRAKVNKVGHVVLLVKDVMTSVKFYSEVVDLKENLKGDLSLSTSDSSIARGVYCVEQPKSKGE